MILCTFMFIKNYFLYKSPDRIHDPYSDAGSELEDYNIKEAVESCFTQMRLSLKPDWSVQQTEMNSSNSEDTSDSQEDALLSTDSSDSASDSENIFMYYDNRMTEIEKKLDKTTRKLKQKLKRLEKKMLKKENKPKPVSSQTSEGRRLKRLEQIMFKKKNKIKPVSIQTSGGRRFLCMLCDSTSKSWGRGCAHIAKVHTGEKIVCEYCPFSTFNPDSFNRHRKKHVH